MGCVSEIKISYKNRVTSSNLTKISASSDAAKILFETWDNDTIELHESFKIMLLNNSNIVKGIYEISSGGITGTLVDIRIIFAVVLKSLSTAIILAHNHPSGNLKPSDSDKRLTSKIKQASELLDIKLLDHLIITPSQEYFSFADDGII
ncbi:JAB domain-containing protein [Lutimonas halocynthiae]|uniref:JAB domain-containing protein n=1 Tax=Lutimonas halocynthiae TaxID=1446477 RepID=UPI0025B459F8|nr:JAB domain-containing protein [Lutimonas halocynthiae]MDN3641896.1 JAB domain-containing protein [Lutimonas halocynthiae]